MTSHSPLLTANFFVIIIIIISLRKYENEDLIKYGLPEDVWFHVDELSSAHVYLRMKPGMTLDDISEDLLLDCAALVKANSIVGCKVQRGLNVDSLLYEL